MLRIHLREVLTWGSSRSDRLLISGPDPGLGAATIVRRGICCVHLCF